MLRLICFVAFLFTSKASELICRFTSLLCKNGSAGDADAPRGKTLKLRFGIEDGRTRTLEEVGKEFNVTRERIRQIEAKALRKFRHPSRSKKRKDFLN